MSDSQPRQPHSAKKKRTPRAPGLEEGGVLGETTADAKREDAISREATVGEEPPRFMFNRRFLIDRRFPGWAISLVVHLALLALLAFLTFPTQFFEPERELVIAPDESEQAVESLEPTALEPTEIELLAEESLQVEPQVQLETTSTPPVESDASAAMAIDLADLSLQKVPRNELSTLIGGLQGNDLSGRGEQVRSELVARYGGSQASEAAVASGLKWIEAHQMADGGWSFAHHLAPSCKGRCDKPGVPLLVQARSGATGLALLPFLGAGQTHKSPGPYRKTVKAGLAFLMGRMRPDGSLWEKGGTFYSHGIATIALCEAYAMTGDKKLAPYAQRAIDFIVRSQDPVGGGWRYEPRQPGDTSVSGWQVMALKSAYMGKLHVPAETIRRVELFLNSVQLDGGARYGYLNPKTKKDEGTTAVGLLSRMYLGSKKSNPALARGVGHLMKWGPSPNNYYYNYYATQILRHWGGDEWTDWNRIMRDQTVARQEKKGHLRGSWFFEKDHSSEVGGRLYCTAMAVMILEVYYRHLPIYAKESVQADFPLD